MQIYSYFCRVKNLNDIIHPIAPELEQFEIFFEQTLHAETEPMDSIMHYVLETKGKRLRPILVLLSARLFGSINERTFRAATFVEMIHSATLIHDDVVDDANTRRGQPSVNVRFGNHSAVLAGDYLFAKAMLVSEYPSDHYILQEMLRTASTMSEGELLQNLQSTDYLDIITRKTAMLMRSCCTVGALSVDATSQQVNQIGAFGLNFGILFQLRDDLLDGENTDKAMVMLPIYLEKAMQSLNDLKSSETLEILKALTVFCAEREK